MLCSRRDVLILLIFVSSVVPSWCTADSPPSFLRRWGSCGSGNFQFVNTYQISLDAAANVYIADTGNHRVLKYTSPGSFSLTFGSFGSGDCQLRSPRGIALDVTGNIYVADSDNHRVQKFSPMGACLARWGINGSMPGQFNFPWGIAVGPTGVYVADTYNHRIQKFSTAGVYIRQWGTNGSAAGQFNYPTGIATDSNENVYVADKDNHRIQVFDKDGAFLRAFGGPGSLDGQFLYPHGVTVDGSGNVYVTDTNNHRVQKFTSTGTWIVTWGSNGCADGQFNLPTGIAVASNGEVYVGEYGNCRVSVFGVAVPVINLLSNGSFEIGPTQGCYQNFSAGSNAISGWSVVRGSVYSMLCCFWQDGAGDRSLEFTADNAPNPGEAGSIAQTVGTIAGHTYRLTFALAGNPDNVPPTIKHLRVTAAAESADFFFDVSGKSRGTMGWAYQQFVFTAVTEATRIALVGKDDNTCCGAAVDDVRLVDTGAAAALVKTRPSSFWVGSPSGAAVTKNLTLKNAGGGDLYFEIEEAEGVGSHARGRATLESVDLAWLDVNPRSGRVSSGDSLNVAVQFGGTGVSDGRYDAYLIVRTNDGPHSSIALPVSFFSGGATADGPQAGPLTRGTLRIFPVPAREEVTFLLGKSASPGHRTLCVIDLGGRVVARLPVGVGAPSVKWDGRLTSGKRVDPGVYFARLQEGESAAIQRFCLVR